MASQAIDTYDRQQSINVHDNDIAGQWSRVCCLVLATELLRGCWVSSCTGGRGQTSDTCTGTSSLSTEHSLDNMISNIYMMSQDTPSHACKPSSPCSCSPRRPAAPAAWKYRVTAAPALCFVFKGSSHCFLFPPESAEVCVLGVRVRVRVAGVQQVGGGGGDCKS